jgi:hypothetical protein
MPVENMKYTLLIYVQTYEGLKNDVFYLGPVECNNKIGGSHILQQFGMKTSLPKTP